MNPHSFLKCWKQPKIENGAKAVAKQWPQPYNSKQVESTNIHRMNFFHSTPHTNVDAIIYIDVREFQKHNKKIVWLMVFAPAAPFVLSPVCVTMFRVCVSVQFTISFCIRYICMKTEAMPAILYVYAFEKYVAVGKILFPCPSLIRLHLLFIAISGPNKTSTSLRFVWVSSTSTSYHA